ncbi:ABC transporter ATP-binding protein [Kibdelosporangium phytohabitans]|uniref:ABC transporter n=1 Tax=Kibdelosporangium phytohabitans TaxID=860235 RepID=A0A0N9IGL3_9PSEU|nr:ABC transporter ATP-binding protein [Kibdelosporangium phytohabitans]ALG14009.1 ABC transporter [Kibdelosporangium phytohabitans]MBE1467036.1 putative ABC transport system ATP-binding protein [Kibdelosporangium phytohabitans]
MNPVIEITALRKTYGSGDTEVHALRGVDLAVWPGEYLAIMGASGSGKSTLLNVLGCLDVPTQGTYKLDGIDVGDLNERQLSLVRNRKIGFVFQSYNLVPRTSSLSNVELPLIYAGVGRKERRARAMAALEVVGLVDRAGHKPNQLSGGQQQRVALARALVTGPAMVLADEPTGNLDSESTDEVLAVFDRLNQIGRTIVMITHEDHVAARAARVVRVSDGRIVEDTSQWRMTGALT